MASLIALLKKLPIDLGQREMRHRSKGKKIALARAGFGNGRDALDLGCGDGFWTEKLQAQGWNVVAIDAAVEYNDARVVDINHGLPFADNSFDLVLSLEVIAYLHNPEFIITEIKRVLRPGGVYIITTPNNGFWLNGALALFGSSLKSLQDPKQKHFFVMRDIQRLFLHSRVYGFFPYLFLKWRISRFIGLLSPTFVIVGKN